MSLLKLARDPFKKEEGVWLDFAEEHGLKLRPLFHPEVSEAYIKGLEALGELEEGKLDEFLKDNPEKAKEFGVKVLSAALTDWKGMSIDDKERAETKEEVLANLQDPRLEHLAERAILSLSQEDKYRPDVTPKEEDIIKN